MSDEFERLKDMLHDIIDVLNDMDDRLEVIEKNINQINFNTIGDCKKIWDENR